MRELVASDGIDASEILLVDAIGKNSKVVSLNMYVARFVTNIFFIAKAGFLKENVENLKFTSFVSLDCLYYWKFVVSLKQNSSLSKRFSSNF